jgi:murein DD-endopeptidase MepM/ murein hydrolase activator NlpD
MRPAIVRIVARLHSTLAASARVLKARFADLCGRRRARLASEPPMPFGRQLAVLALRAGGSLCIAGYGTTIVVLISSHAASVPASDGDASSSREVAALVEPPIVEPQPEMPAFADLTVDVARMIDAREPAIDRVIVERVQASLDRERAQVEREQAIAERDAALAVDRAALLDLHARTSRTIAQIEGILSATGMAKAGGTPDSARPRGGPFVPWSERAVRAGGGNAARCLASFSWGVERLSSPRDVLAHLPLASPLAKLEVFDNFGFRHDPFTGRGALHEGVDLRGTLATPVMATADGVVSFAGWYGDYGNMVEIDHGYGLATRYAHLSRIMVKVGAPIALHEELGFVGVTGRVTALHLHYEIRADGRPRNPVNFFKAGHHVPEADRAVAQEIPFAPDAFAGFDRGQGAPDFWRAVDRQR